MSQINRPTITDDSGTFTDGTIFDEAFFDDIFDEVDDQCHSTTNPTVKPKAITDEVVAARGNMASLDARISGVVDDDGAPVPSASSVTQAQVRSLAGNFNVIQNGDLEDWAAGASAAPDHFALSGAGAAIARTGTGEADTTDLGVGTYAAKITSGGGAAARLTQEVIAAATYALHRAIDGRKVGACVRVKVASNNVVRLVIADGTTTTESDYAPGSADEQYLSVTHTISASATKLDVYVEVAQGANVAYAGGFVMVFGDLAPSAWTPLWAKFRRDILDEAVPSTADVNNLGTTTVNIGGRLSTIVSNIGNVGGGTDDLHSYAVPAGLLAVDGQVLRVTYFVQTAANANAKSLNAVFGGTSMSAIPNAVSHNNEYWVVTVTITRLSATTQRMQVVAIGYALGAGTSLTFSSTAASPTETLANAITFKFTAAASSDNDVQGQQIIVEILP